MCKITIIDGICGSGKSQGMIKYMKEHPYKKYICFTQFISEAHRYAGTQPKSKTCDEPKLDKAGNIFYQKPSMYNCSELSFKHPVKKGRSHKTNNFRALIEERENIVSTHKMLTQIGSDIQELISASSYVAVLDEVVDPIQEYQISSNNKKDLLDNEYLLLDEDGVTLKWNYFKYPDKRRAGDNFYKEQMLADSNNLILVNNRLFLWEMSAELFNCFSEVFILTYQFHGSPLQWFFEAKGIDFRVEYKTKPTVSYGELINIVEDERLNAIGDSNNFLSSNSSKKLSTGIIKDLKSNLTFLRKHVWSKEDASSRIWTCLGSMKEHLGVDGWKKDFVSFNIRGSNEYKHTKNAVYLYNVFLNPFIIEYFSKYDIKVDEETYALNSLLQWLFRTQLREGKPVNIYIPSKRMRGLLKEWCAKN